MVADPDAELQAVLEEVRYIEVQSRRLVLDLLAGGYSSVFRGRGIEFDEVREYVPGDDPRHVDWNVTARTGRPHVKKYAEERERSVLFLLDCSASMTGGFGPWSPRDAAVRVCACLALAAVRNDDRVGLAAFGREVEHYVPPRKGSGHALRVIRDCLVYPGRMPAADPGAALDFAAKVARRGAILFLVSDFLESLPPGERPSWREPLGLCARRHDVIAVRLLPPELAVPEAGLMRVRDPETGRALVVDWKDARTRAAYEARAAAWRRGVEEALRRAGVDCMDVPLPREPDRDAVVRPILRFFRLREMRGAKA